MGYTYLKFREQGSEGEAVFKSIWLVIEAMGLYKLTQGKYIG